MTIIDRLNKLGMILLCCLIFPGLAWAQTDDASFTKRPKRSYLVFNGGPQYATFRDWATSPLHYSGLLPKVALSHLELHQSRESGLYLSYSFGSLKNDVNQHHEESTVNFFTLSYQELFGLPSLSLARLKVKIGGQLSTSFNLRDNEALFNNSKGVEGLVNFMGSLKTSFDLSRTKSKTSQFLFIRYPLKPRKRLLAFNLNIGIVNATYRNGYLYTGHAAITNSDDFFESYEWRFFSGFRVNSSLDYTIYLSNENALRFSYQWDAYSTGGPQAFEMAQHNLTLSFLFQL